MHSLSHPCGAVLNTHHGLTNAVVMPYVLEFNRTQIDDKLGALARYLGLSEASFHGVLQWILDLRAQIGIPHTLHDISVREEHVPQLAPMAESDPSSASNPVKLTVENLERLYLSAIRGTMQIA